MLKICTFDPKGGGNVFYKAIAHPLAAEALHDLIAQLGSAVNVALYDPDGNAQTLFELYPGLKPSAGIYTHDTEKVGLPDGIGGKLHAIVDIAASKATHILAVSFEDEKMRARLARMANAQQKLLTLRPAQLPDSMLSNRRHYLDKVNFVTNFAFFRDDDDFSTRLVTANYWENYGSRNLRYWFRLYDGCGAILAQWEQPVADSPQGVVIESTAIRERFNLAAFTGQLFIHVLGARGHDVLKYALDTIGKGKNASLSVTHDANAWPSPRFASLPAPTASEKIILWLQNSHAEPIPAGAITLNIMGEDKHHPIALAIAPFATQPVDVGDIVKGVAWPAQLELRSGNHIVRPRYEVIEGKLTRIAHLNVERQDLKPEPALSKLAASLGRGIILPFPILDPKRYTTLLQPNPMSEFTEHLPVRVDIFDEDGSLVHQKFLGNLPRNHRLVEEIHTLTDRPGHGDIVYDFSDGGVADGWLHAMLRYRDRTTSHAAETSFGGHIFNTFMTWRTEPQSYSGPPPGLTTRLFLKLGDNGRRSFSCLIYPASAEGWPPSKTDLNLFAASGEKLAVERISINASGSRMIWPDEIFGPELMRKAGDGGYVLIRDLTCRLFGYHGQMNAASGFSLDHMFGF